MVLTVFAAQAAKPAEKPFLMTDGNGLHLLVTPNGSKLWRFRYRFGGKQNLLSLGAFPEVSLAVARDKRDDARKLLRDGIDPSQKRREDRTAANTAAKNTFSVVAKEYLEKLKAEGRSQATLEKNEWLLLNLAKPLAHRPITQIKPAEILGVLKQVEKSGRRHSSHRLQLSHVTVRRGWDDPDRYARELAEWNRKMAERPNTSKHFRYFETADVLVIAARIERLVAADKVSQLRPPTGLLVVRALRFFAAQPTRDQLIALICGGKTPCAKRCYSCTGKANAILQLYANSPDPPMP